MNNLTRKYILKITLLAISLFFTASIFASASMDNPPDITEDSTKKIVYLTFDDGPSENTTKILDILKENDVKATFFIISPYIPSHNEIVKRIYDEGHSLGNHTADHEFNKIYTSEEAFMKSLNKQQEFIKSLTGSECRIFRFPGGSKNTLVRNAHGKDFTKNIIIKLEQEGFHCYDWNVDSGDSHASSVPVGTICNNILKEMKDKEGNFKNPAIVLMHDCRTKKTTVQALPEIIKIFKDNGYEFDTLK